MSSTPSTDARIAWAAGHLQRHLDRRIRIASLARSVQLSPSRFTHLFRAHTGLSPARYVQDLRLQRARVLLERTFLSVGDVMLLVGYQDPSHFSRDFKRRHGLPPSQIRDHNRATPLHGPGVEDGNGTMPGPPDNKTRH